MIPTSVVSFFCEDIRSETGGRNTLIGIYPDNVSLPEPPHPLKEGEIRALPKLCVFTRISFDPAGTLGPISAKIINPDGSEADLGGVDAKIIADAQKAALDLKSPLAAINMTMQSAPYIVPVFGRTRIEIIIGDETFLGGALNIQPEAAKA